MNIMDAIHTIWKAVRVWWDGWFWLLVFGLVWALCWVTVVLGPPATFGFFHATHWWMTRGETRWDQYFQAGKKYFLKSWLWFLALLFVFLVAYANFAFYARLAGSLGPVMQGVSLGVGFLWVVIQFYALPYFELLEKKSLWMAWKNGLFTILAAPLYSLVILVVLVVLAYLHITILPLILGVPGLIVVLASMAVSDLIHKFGIGDKEPAEEVDDSPWPGSDG
jgi:uncharacterized membrane protein YesL